MCPGDDLRHVHWRSSAKADTLQVRQYQDTRRSHLTVVIDDDRHSYSDPEDFETTVSAAASIATRAHRDGVDLSMLCGEHAVTGRGLDGVLDACCRIEPGSSDPVQAARKAMRLARRPSRHRSRATTSTASCCWSSTEPLREADCAC